MRLKTQKAHERELRGTVTLFLFGTGIDKVAFLDIDDMYTFEPFVSENQYKLYRAMDALHAYKMAEEFLSQTIDYQSCFLSKILTETDNVVGYEVYPSYNPISYSPDDLPQISYKLNGAKVIVYITVGDFGRR